jgi:D-sedoheptulose 7-phosphate isomerase
VTNDTYDRLPTSPALKPFEVALDDALQVLSSMPQLEHSLQVAAAKCISAFRGGNKLLVCGNGGSACDAQHLVGELVGRYKSDRIPLSAIAMTADSAVLTCIGNDYCFEEVFVRQIQAFAKPGDIVVVFTTSGNSKNVLEALKTARTLQLISIAFLGRDGGEAASLADCALRVSHTDTARIQEGHQFLIHSMMDIIEAEFVHG